MASPMAPKSTKRVSKKPERFQDIKFPSEGGGMEGGGGVSLLPDDFAEHEHDAGHFDKNDATFGGRAYKKYKFDNMSMSSFDSGSLSEQFERMSITRGGGGGPRNGNNSDNSDSEDEESDGSYDGSFVSNDMDPKTYDDDPMYTIAV